LPGYYVLLVNEERIIGFDIKTDVVDKKVNTELVIRKPQKEKPKARALDLDSVKSPADGDRSYKMNSTFQKNSQEINKKELD
jgi:hypothetical protein